MSAERPTARRARDRDHRRPRVPRRGRAQPARHRLSLGFDLPYFCWHPAMGSIGACRQCAVHALLDEQRRRRAGEIVMACMTAAPGGHRASPSTTTRRCASAPAIIELLMISHPHDCPVCDEGGECHLQDMTVMTGHVYRRYRFRKRTFRNQDLGPVRDPRDEPLHPVLPLPALLQRLRRRPRLRRLRPAQPGLLRARPDGTLESEFSGNLVEVCPVGVFDDKTFAGHYTRKWDLQTAPAVCLHCGLRLQRPSPASATASCAASQPLQRRGQRLLPLRPRPLRLRVRQRAAAHPRRARGVAAGLRGAAGLAGRAARAGAGARGRACAAAPRRHRLAARLAGSQLRAARAGRRRALLPRALRRDDDLVERRRWRCCATVRRAAASLRDIEAADPVLVLGEDLTNTAPMLAFAVRRWERLRPTAEEERLHIRRWNDAGVGASRGRAERAVDRGDARRQARRDRRRGLHAAPDDLARLALRARARARPGARRRSPTSATPSASAVTRWAAALRAAERPRDRRRRRLRQRGPAARRRPPRAGPARRAAPAGAPAASSCPR